MRARLVVVATVSVLIASSPAGAARPDRIASNGCAFETDVQLNVGEGNESNNVAAAAFSIQ